MTSLFLVASSLLYGAVGYIFTHNGVHESGCHEIFAVSGSCG